MRSGALDQPVTLLSLGHDLAVHQHGWLWMSLRASEAAGVPPANGLRSPAPVVIRSWWDDQLLPGRYLQAESRLLHIDSVRDITGRRAEAIISATELIGMPATYHPADGSPIPCRVHLTHEAPHLDDQGQVTDYRTRAEVALIEVGRPQVEERLVVAGVSYIITEYASETDDGIVRGLWLDLAP